jgi:hypothetical protein
MSLGVAILILGLLCLLIFSPGFRRVAAVALGVLVVALLIFVGWYKRNEAEEKRKRDAAKAYIKTSQIELVDPRVSFSSYDGRPERLTGRIRNNSRYALGSVEIRVVFQDCSPQNECETVEDMREEVHANVPPGQSRDFQQYLYQEYLYGSTFSPKGRITWTYQILSVSADVQ